VSILRFLAFINNSQHIIPNKTVLITNNTIDTFRFHCTVCDDFDLCVPCYQKMGHVHKMIRLGFDLDDGSSPLPGDPKQSNPQEARKLSIQRCIQSLVHACQCRDANCRLPSCHKLKRVVSHAKVCSFQVRVLACFLLSEFCSFNT